MKNSVLFLLAFLVMNTLLFNAAAQDKAKATVPSPEELPIVIVNAGNLNRAGIADLINKINKQDPAVVGVNFTFEEKRDGDGVLIEALQRTKHLIMNCHEDVGVLTTSYFNGFEYGQCNLRRNHHSQVDLFPPVLDVNDEKIEHLAMKVLKYWDPEKYKALSAELKDLSNSHRVTFMKIHYLEKNLASFQTVDQSELKKAPRDVFKGKIVLIGYLGEKIDYQKYVTDEEDAFLIPLSHHHNEKNPMYATVILANIIQTLILGELKSFHHE